MSKTVLKGIFVPHVTPFSREDEIDINALRACVNFWIENGISGLVTCGSNGEAPYLSRQERLKVIETVVDEVNSKIPVIAGTGSMSTKETIVFTQDAKNAGADAALIVTPFYFKLSNREILEHYKAVTETVDLPIVVYNVPKFTSFSIEPALIAKIAEENEKIVGVKDSSGNIGAITETIRLVGSTISVLAGTAEVMLPTLSLGGRGAIVAIANVFPKLCVNLYQAFESGNYEEAGKLQRLASFANEVLVKKHNQLSAIKEVLTLQGLSCGHPRKPALPLDSGEKKNVVNMLKFVNDNF